MELVTHCVAVHKRRRQRCEKTDRDPEPSLCQLCLSFPAPLGVWTCGVCMCVRVRMCVNGCTCGCADVYVELAGYRCCFDLVYI